MIFYHQVTDLFYTVQIVNSNNTQGLKDDYLKSGTKFFRKGSARGEYGERFSDLTTGTGFRENSTTL